MTVELLHDQIHRVIGRAILAPSIHNSQPWRFHVVEGGVEVWADRRRQLRRIDPRGRQLVVSVGAAVEFTVLALRAEGFDVDCRVLPDATEPDLIARITAIRPRTVDPVTRALVHAMSRRATYREAFERRPVPEGVISAIRESAHVAGCGTLQVRDEHAPDLAVLLERAEADEVADAEYRTELEHWRTSGVAAVDGVPDSALSHQKTRASRIPLRHFDTDSLAPSEPDEVDDPVLLLVTTTSDEPADWIQAGRALARVLLTATTLGVQSSPVTQSLDDDGYRRRTAAVAGALGHAQIMLRLGYGIASLSSPTTPRRHFDDVVTGSGGR